MGIEGKSYEKNGAIGEEENGETTPLLPAGKESVESHKDGDWCGLRYLEHHFGMKLLVMLFASQHLLKGFAHSFINPCQQFLYASYGVPATQMQIFTGVVTLPWSLKPIIGLISDAVPVCGFNKMPYIFFSSIVGLFCTSSVGLVSQDKLDLGMLVACLFAIQLMISVCDLLVEAKYSEKMRAKPEHGPALMTYVWFGLNACGLVATLMVGPVLSKWGPKMPFTISLLPMAFILLPLMWNYLEERVREPDEVAAIRARFAEQSECCFLCVLMFWGTMVLTYVGIKHSDPVLNASMAACVAVIMLIAFSITMRPIIAKVNAFFLLQSSMTFSITGATFYFYTDSVEAYPEGPHFSRGFYTSVMGVAASICTLVGIYSYQKYASTWSYQRLLLASNVVMSIMSFMDIVIFKRINLSLGIPDEFFVLGSSAFQFVVFQWQWMPGVVINAQLCPQGMEATMYALLAGCHNLGVAISSSCGALLLQILGCRPSGQVGESEQFDNLWKASLVATVTPMITLVMVPWLIPNAKQTDRLLEDGDRDATVGSLWRSWRGQ